jgi:hypothetical protein
VATAFLEYLFNRNSDALISRLYDAVPPDARTGFYERLYHSASVTVFVVVPLAGAIVGVFVGLLQRTWVRTVAVCCLIPDFVFGFLGDTRKVWAHSAKGISIYAFDEALPFAAAILAATVCRYLLTREHAHLQNSA